MICLTCERANDDGARFCDTCGAALAQPQAAPPPPATGQTVALSEASPASAPPEPVAPRPAPAARQPSLVRLRQMNGGSG